MLSGSFRSGWLGRDEVGYEQARGAFGGTYLGRGAVELLRVCECVIGSVPTLTLNRLQG